ncbi:putative 28S ribosomal protein [Naja naja]|nr:putative 28S ribosomal protein [Naja naja]
MASPVVEKVGCLVRQLRASRKLWLPGLTQVRWSRYSPAYIDPEVNKEIYRKSPEEMSEEDKNKQQLKTIQPVKATESSITSSVFYDPAISEPFTILPLPLFGIKTLEAIKRKQLAKYHEADEEMKEKIECNPYKIFHQAIENCQPVIGLVGIIRGGKKYQVPTPLKISRRRFLAMKWMITECRENKHRRTLMPEKLSNELLEASNNSGNVIKKKHELHKMAEANRAFAHYRWG